MSDQLTPIEPAEALDLYLQDCAGELTEQTIQSREYNLAKFVDWCHGHDEDADEPRLTDMNDISGRDFHRFKTWRKQNFDINKVTLKRNVSDLKQFMKFCVKIDAVPAAIPEKVGVPVLEHGEKERETYMDVEEVREILEYLETFEYASLDHVLFLLAWQTGARRSGLHSLDVGDLDFDKAQIEFVHRPDQGTSLKNQGAGERIVTLPDETMAVLAEHVERRRVDVEDEYGRRPLFATEYGRMHRNFLPKHLYRVTLPCLRGECPDGRDPEECEHYGSYDKAVSCPHNTRPHDIRRGSITHWLRQDTPTRVVSDRMNVSQKAIEKHYDARTDQEKAEVRRNYLDNLDM